MLDFLHFMPWFEACFVPICRCTYLYIRSMSDVMFLEKCIYNVVDNFC